QPGLPLGGDTAATRERHERSRMMTRQLRSERAGRRPARRVQVILSEGGVDEVKPEPAVAGTDDHSLEAGANTSSAGCPRRILRAASRTPSRGLAEGWVGGLCPAGRGLSSRRQSGPISWSAVA